MKNMESVHKDCESYQHSDYVNQTCCGGTVIKRVVEMILCKGKRVSCSNCDGCINFRRKNEHSIA